MSDVVVRMVGGPLDGRWYPVDEVSIDEDLVIESSLGRFLYRATDLVGGGGEVLARYVRGLEPAEE